MGGITTTIGKVKYIGIASLTIAILSILILNIISSYSSSNIESNAIDSNSEVSTLANDSSICNPTNTNAAACISLSITSSSSSSTGGNDANLSLSIPQGGGIATGRHTVSVSSNNVAGYYVMLTGNAGSPAMTPSATTSQAFIQSTTGTLANPTYLDKGQWGSWGVALPNSSLYTGFNTNEMDYSSTDQDVLHKTTWAAVPGKESDDSDKTIIKTTASSKKTDSYPVYYGVRVDSPVSVPADTYAAQVVYTATTNEVPTPTITSTSSNTYELGSGADSTVTIAGTNLASTYKVYIESNTDSTKQYDITNTITNLTDTGLTVTIPTDQTNPDLEPGDYTIHVVTQGGEGSAGFSYTRKTLPDGILESTDDYGEDGHVAVDYDENMIPVTYIDNETTPRWVIADPSNNNANDSLNWYNYPAKKWANAVTLTEEGLAKYKGQSVGTEIDEQYVLGYWVYIPRYAYKVMRKEVADKVVTDDEAKNNGKGGFEIVFETSSDVVKEPAACNNSNANQYYQDCIKNQYGDVGINYPGNNSELSNKTAWATHPAFTWQYTEEINGFDKTYELNGFWIGKFEMTGSTSRPTVLPNRRHLSGNGVSNRIGSYYSISKSIGAEDINNKYGSTVQTSYNNGKGYHNLDSFNSHMLKNREWGAVAYLSANSKYGSGINGVQINANETYGNDDDGRQSSSITGCGPKANGDEDYYYSSGTLGTTGACDPYDTSKTYNGSKGILASTSGNVHGVYDMSGAAWEYVAGGYTINYAQSSTSQFVNAAKPPYVDLYVNPPFNSSNVGTFNENMCTWELCGGQALYETKTAQNIGYSMYPQTWGDDYTDFVYADQTWFARGGFGAYTEDAGLFGAKGDSGGSGGRYDQHGFRVTLLVLMD